jgi:hypothetical protein
VEGSTYADAYYLISGVLSYSLAYGGEYGSLHLIIRAEFKVKEEDYAITGSRYDTGIEGVGE